MLTRGISGTRAGKTFAAAVDTLLSELAAERAVTHRWLAERHTERIVDVERRFNLPPGSLRRSAETQRRAHTDR